MRSNEWTLEENKILAKNFNRKPVEVVSLLKDAGYERSIKAVERKREKARVCTYDDAHVKAAQETHDLLENNPMLKEKSHEFWDKVQKKGTIVGIKPTLTEILADNANYALVEKIRLEEPTVVPEMTLVKTLVIPDCHVSPEDNLTRFSCAAKLIEERRPDNIIFMGDFLTLASLSHWEKNNRLVMEGRRYKEDIAAGREALDRILAPIKKHKSYNPSIIWLLGNHESWVDKYLEQNPTLDGHIDLVEDLQLYSKGITSLIPYRRYYEVEGVLFTHAPQNAANMPVGGESCTQKASKLTAKSLVFGHTHRAELSNCFRHGSNDLVQVYTAGCFFENTDEYAEGGANAYWKGLSILTHWAPGRFDLEQISLERLMYEY